MSEIPAARAQVAQERAARLVNPLGRPLIPILLPLVLMLGLAYELAAMAVAGSPLLPLAIALAIPGVVVIVRYPFAALLAWALFLPYFVKPSGDAGLFYNVFHRALLPGTLAAIVLSRLVRGETGAPRVRLGLPELAIAGYATIAIVNILVISTDPAMAAERLLDRAIVPISAYLLIRFIDPGPSELRWLIPVALITIAAQGSIGILSWVAPGVLPPGWRVLVGSRTGGTFANPNAFASVLVFCGLILFAMLRRPGRWPRGLLAGAAATVPLFVAIAFARASWLAGGVVALLLNLRYPRQLLGWTAAAAVVAVLAGATVLAPAVAFAQQRLANDETADARIVGDVASLRLIGERPLLGWGYDDFDLYWNGFKVRVGDLAVSEGSTSHNTFLTMAVETGLPSLLLFLFPTAYWLVESMRMRRRLDRDDPPQSLVFPLWITIAFILTAANFYDPIRFLVFVTTTWWVALGLIAVAVERARREEALLVEPMTAPVEPLRIGAEVGS
jgi:O-antigen ligase